MRYFEDFFSDILTDIVYFALNFTKNSMDKIYIHCSNEKNCISSNVFFQKDGKKIKRRDIKDVSDVEQRMLIHSINEKIKEIDFLCKNNKQKSPTEIKLIYEVSEKHLVSKLNYENLYSDSENLIVQNIFDNWFESV